ncbi:PorT family protein [Flavobacteriaceae bacterium F08102]|nr:PorT family protein [Flavobacteriaceae bacterium F08102]
MKKLVLTVLTLTLATSVLTAQKIDFGIKAGVNYNFGGDLEELFSDTGNNIEDIVTGADDRAGYHAGVYFKFNFTGLYIRPELVYTKLTNYYANTSNPLSLIDTEYSMQKLDIPLLFGTKIIGPLHVFGGPSFQYILDNDFSFGEIRNVGTKDFTVGLQLGTGIELGRLGVDIRWEKGFSNKVDATLFDTNIKLDNRPNQIIFGIAYRFNER